MGNQRVTRLSGGVREPLGRRLSRSLLTWLCFKTEKLVAERHPAAPLSPDFPGERDRVGSSPHMRLCLGNSERSASCTLWNSKTLASTCLNQSLVATELSFGLADPCNVLLIGSRPCSKL